MASTTSCPACKATLTPAVINTPEPTRCPACNVGLWSLLFPARGQEPAAGQAGQTIMDHGDASCFYHPTKQATIVCEGCGRFLCALCDIELAGAHQCSNCIEAGRSKGTLESIDKSRTLYDEIALALAILPILAWPATLLTAPATMFVVLRNWRKPGGIIPRTRIRYVIAALIAVLEMAGWAVGLAMAFA